MFEKVFSSNVLFKNITTLVGGTFLAQLIPILLQSVLRRMYPAEDFGAFEIFVSLTGMFMILANFRYEMAVVLPRKKADAVNLVFLGFFLSFLFGTAMLVIISLFHSYWMSLLNLNAEYGFILYLSPLSIFFFSAYQMINYYLVREKEFKSISINKISRRLGEGGVQTSLGGLSNMGLVWGDVFGHLVNNITGLWQMKRKGFSFRLFSFERQWRLMKEYRKFPFFVMGPTFLNQLCLHLPLIAVNIMYSQEITAYFGFARLVLMIPASMLALSISQVLLQSLTEKFQKRESVVVEMRKVMLGLLALSIIMIVFIQLWAPALFSLYAGSEYHISGQFARILVFAAGLKLVVSPVSSIFIAFNRLKLLSYWQAFYFLLICTLFLLKDQDIFRFLQIYLLIELVSYGVYLYLIVSLIWSYERNIAKE